MSNDLLISHKEYLIPKFLDRYSRRYLRTLVEKFIYRDVLKDVGKQCLFIGYPRSGHTLVAALLDAHPNIVVSNGVDILQYLERGFDLPQIYCLCLRQSKRFVQSGSKSNGYDYFVPNQWNGRFSRLDVIGDKSGDLFSERLRTNPKSLELVLQQNIETKFIHVIRNPLDNIATYSIKNNISLDKAVSYYYSLCETVNAAKIRIDTDAWIDIRIEELIGNSSLWLERLCAFLGQNASSAYLADCAKLVFESPRKTRHHVAWTPDLIHRIESESKKYSFLSGYRFDFV